MALQKVPADRFESAAKFAEALANPAFTTRGTAQLTGASGHTRGVATQWFVAMTAVALVTSALAVWGWQRAGGTTSASAQSVQLAIDLPDSVQVDNVSVSPDGGQVVIGAIVNGRRTLLSRRIDDLELREIPGTSGGRDPFFSPDGEWIAFFADMELRKVRSDGGASQRLATFRGGVALGRSRSGTWGPNGTIVVASGVGDGLSRVDANGGPLQQLTTVDTAQGDLDHFVPVFLNDGQTIAYRIASNKAGSPNDFATISLDGRATRRPWPGWSFAPWSRDSLVVWNPEDRGLSFTSLPQGEKTVGTLGPSLVTEVRHDTRTGEESWDLSSTGTLVYLREQTDLQLVTVTRSGEARPLMPTGRPFVRPRVSPDGQRIVATVRGASGQASELWSFDRRASTLQRLTFGGGASAVWSADGTHVVFTRDGDLYWQMADGSGVAERLLARPGTETALAATPDGSGVVFVDSRDNGDIWLLPLTGDRTPRPILATEFTEIHASVSPDGKWMAYTSNVSGRDEVYVRPFPSPGASVQVSVEGAEMPVWSRSGRELFFRDGSKMVAAAVLLAPTFAVTSRTVLFTDSFSRPPGFLNYDVLPDGGFAMLQPSGASQLIVITSWPASVTRPRAK